MVPILQQDAVTAYAIAQSDAAYQKIQALLEQAYQGDINAWLKIVEELDQIGEFASVANIAGRMVGLTSPFFPQAQDNPEGSPKPSKIDLATSHQQMLWRMRLADLEKLAAATNRVPVRLAREIEKLKTLIVEAGGSVGRKVIYETPPRIVAVHPTFSADPTEGLPASVKFNFPAIEQGVKFLKEKRVISKAALEQLTEAEKQRVFNTRSVANQKTLARLQVAAAESFKAGEDLRAFRQRIAPVVELSRSESETLFRTNIKQAYVDGMDQTLAKPELADQFGYVMYVSTRDPRTRHNHLAMNRFVCSRGDPAYQVVRFLLGEWNCRCSMIPLTKKRAEQLGIKTLKDIPFEVLAHARASGVAV